MTSEDDELPLSSFLLISHTDFHEPTSLHPACIGITTESGVLLSKEIFDVPLSLSKTIEYLVEKEIKKVTTKGKSNGKGSKG